MMRFVACTASELYEACLLAMRRVYLFIAAYARLHFSRFPPPAPGPVKTDWKIYKVLAFCEDPPPPPFDSDAEIMPDEATLDFADVTEWFTIKDWDLDVAHNYPEWNKWKLEIRYTHRGEKFRHLIRRGDPLVWPPQNAPLPDSDADRHRLHELSKPKGILSASLVPRPGLGATAVDITHRLKKYAGVTRDFATASSDIKAHDILPMDDNDWNAQRFQTIRIVKAHPVRCISVDDVNYAENGLVGGGKKE